jgi:hypothetical protein
MFLNRSSRQSLSFFSSIVLFLYQIFIIENAVFLSDIEETFQVDITIVEERISTESVDLKNVQ